MPDELDIEKAVFSYPTQRQHADITSGFIESWSSTTEDADGEELVLSRELLMELRM
jgi:hypothetical protein